MDRQTDLGRSVTFVTRNPTESPCENIFEEELLFKPFLYNFILTLFNLFTEFEQNIKA